MSLRAYGAVIYAVCGVVCFGPAIVESEQARDSHLAACRTTCEQSDKQLACELGAPSTADALFKAAAWPLWVSYALASPLPAAKLASPQETR